MTRLKWSPADKIAAFLVVVLLLATVAWLAIPSSVFIRDVSMTVADRTVRYVRETPYGDVTAEWQAEITLIDGDEFECNSGDWAVATYQRVAGNMVTYNLTDWADPCLAAGPPYYLTITRRALLFGVLPLRAMVQRTEIEGERRPLSRPLR